MQGTVIEASGNDPKMLKESLIKQLESILEEVKNTSDEEIANGKVLSGFTSIDSEKSLNEFVTKEYRDEKQCETSKQTSENFNKFMDEKGVYKYCKTQSEKVLFKPSEQEPENAVFEAANKLVELCMMSAELISSYPNEEDELMESFCEDFNDVINSALREYDNPYRVNISVDQGDSKLLQ